MQYRITITAKCYEDEIGNTLNFLSNKFGVPKESFKIAEDLSIDPFDQQYAIKGDFGQMMLFDTPEELERCKYRVFKEEE